MKKVLLISLILLLSLVGLLLGFIQPIANSIGNWQLQRLYPDSQLHISSLGISQLQLNSLKINSPEMQVQLDNAAVTYNLRGLLGGQILSLKIDSLNVLLNPVDTTKQESAQQSEATFNWPASPLQFLPLQQLSLKQLYFQMQGGQALQGEFNIRKTDEIINVNGLMDIAGQHVTLDMDINHQWQLNLQLHQYDQLLLSHQGRIQQGAKLQAQGKVTIKGAELLALLENVVPAASQLQAQQLDIKGQYKISSPWPLPVDPTQNLDGEMDLHLTAKYMQVADHLQILQANSSLNVEINQGQANWSVSRLSAQAQPAPAALATLTVEQQQLLENLSIELLLPQALNGRVLLQNSRVIANSGDLQITLHNDLMDHKVLLNLASTEYSSNLKQQGKLLLDLRFASPQIPFKRLTWNSPYRLTLGDSLDLLLDQKTHLNLYQLKQDDISLSQVALQLTADTSLHQDQSGQLSSGPMQWKIKQNSLQIGDKKLAPLEHDLKLQLQQSDPVKTSGSFSSNNIQVDDLPASDVHIDFKLDDQLFSAQWSLNTLNQSLTLSGKMRHQLDKQQGQSSLLIDNLPLNKLQLKPLLKEMPLNLLEGQLASKMNIQWQLDKPLPQIQVAGDLALTQLTATYEDVLVEGLDLPLSFKTQNNQPIQASGSINLKQLNPGIPVENITGTHSISLSQDLTHLQYNADNISMQVLGGSIEVPLVRYDNQREVQAVGIYIKDLLMDKLDLLKEKAGLSATGKLNGALPIVISKQGVSIPAGTLKALNPGGIISHDRNPTVQALSQGGQQMKMIFDILENFNYDEMSTEVLLQDDGQLSLSCRLQGKNPGYLNGQAVNFNPNLEINIIDAMKVMRLTNKTTEKFEKYFGGQ